jgi:hypothetical protein
MLKLITLSLALTPMLSVAQTIITDAATISSLNKKFNENTLYRKIGLARFEMFKFDLGKAQTPFYKVASEIKRYYKNTEKCFEITIEDAKTIAQKVKCTDKVKQLKLAQYPSFNVVDYSELVREGLQDFRADSIQESYTMLAYVQAYDMFSIDRAIYGERVEKTAPRRTFTVNLDGRSDVVFTKTHLEYKQDISLKVGAIGILNEKTQTATARIKKNNDGLYFSNQQGQVIIYNSPKPAPFGNYSITLNSKIPAFLEQLAQQSTHAPVCFRDNYVTPGPRDCHKVLFNTHAIAQYKPVKLMLIDFINQTVSLE